MQALLWLKARLLGIFGGIAAILGAVLYIKNHREKVARLKAEAELATRAKEIAVLEAKRDALLDNEDRLKREDDEMGREIDKQKREVVAARESVDGRTSAEVVDRFNELYGRRT